MLHIHRAERADRLVEALGDLVAEPLDDPMQAEVVAVPTRGVERWLTQRLSARLGARPGRADGVCANIDFPFPGRLVGGAVAVAAGVDGETDPWLPERSVWPLIEVVDGCRGEPWLEPLARGLGSAAAGDGAAGDGESGKRFSVLRHVADLYDRYAVHRPAMLRAWAEGTDTDGAGRPLASGALWQAELWRRLRGRISVPSPAERLVAACERLGVQPALVELPRRLSLFGLTRLPASYLQVLRALAAGRDVHLFLLHPSPALWKRVAAAGQLPALRRADDRTAELPRHPLLASWGRDAREMQLVVTAGQPVPLDDHRPVDLSGSSLLERIQADIRADRAPAGAPLPGQHDARARLDPADRSLQVHACHGRGRQVEVVRDAVLHLLADDPTLEPRDVIVMCPDIETFAPLVHATFGAGEVDEGDDEVPPDQRPPDLRVRLADRSLRQTNPVLAVVSELLELASARVSAPEVLDFASREPVRRRFQLDDDLARLEEWVAAAGVRWGLDAAHRAPYRLAELEANTWRAGLDRVLLGVTMAEEDQRLVGGVLPLDDVESGAIDLAGRLAELVHRLGAAIDTLSGPHPLADWATAIGTSADALTATTDDGAWQRAQLRHLLDDVVTEATVDGSISPALLTLADVRALLADRLRGRPTRANFRTGHLTVCTLVPMRSVPHRVVCLLGLDDGVFPRRTVRDGDDLVLDDPHVGDRDSRTEDRQLLLDALLAATERLVVTYSARDERTNAELPPAVPLGELLDVVDGSVRTDEVDDDGVEVPARARVVVHHPLQPFDVRNFAAGALVPGRVWSFDPVALDGARALSGERAGPAPFLAGRLPPVPADLVELEQLVRFLQHPVKAFLRQRLGITLLEPGEEIERSLPIELDNLQRWEVGQRLVDARLAGHPVEACLAAERARGVLPPGQLAGPLLDEVLRDVEDVVQAAASLPGPGEEPSSREVNVALAGGVRLVGTVPGVSGTLLRKASYSRVGPKHRLTAWAQLLALNASRPDQPWAAATVGRVRKGRPRRFRVTVAHLPALAGDPANRERFARQQLEVLVDLYLRGMREPLPLYCDTSAAYASAVSDGNDGPEAARQAWTSYYEVSREDRDPEHRLVLGQGCTLDDVLAAPPCDDEEGEGWQAGEPTRLGRYARRLWDGLLSCEQLVDQ